MRGMKNVPRDRRERKKKKRGKGRIVGTNISKLTSRKKKPEQRGERC